MLNIVCIAEQEKNIQPGIGTNSQLSKFTNKTRHIVFIAPVWRAIRIYIEPCVADYFKGKPEEILPVQIYRVNDYAGIPACDQEEMFTATWFTPEQILAQEVPGGLVFDPFRRSVEEYLEQLGLTLDDFDPSKHKRDEDGKFSSMGNTTSKDESGKENSSKDLNDSQSHAKINSNAVSAKRRKRFQSERVSKQAEAE